MPREYLFVYGTLQRAAGYPMHRVLARHGRRVGPASCQGTLYRIGWFPGLVPGGDAARRVYGELYALENPAPCLALLDRYEDTAGEGEFERQRHAVRCGGRHYPAWVYVYRRPARDYPRIPSGDFLRHRSRRYNAQTR